MHPVRSISTRAMFKFLHSTSRHFFVLQDSLHSNYCSILKRWMFIQDYTLRQTYVHACLLTNVTFRLQSSYQTLRNVMVNVCQSSVLFGRIYGPQTPLRQKVHPSCSKHWSFTLLEGMYATQNSRYISLPATLFIEDVTSSTYSQLCIHQNFQHFQLDFNSTRPTSTPKLQLKTSRKKISF